MTIKGFLSRKQEQQEQASEDVEILCMFQEIASDKKRFKRAIKESKNQLKDLEYRALLLNSTIALKINEK